MGDPKKIRKKYETPSHPWQKVRIEEEIILKKEYGLKNKKEIWIMGSALKNFRNQVKKLHTMRGKQTEIETDQIKTKLLSLGLLKPESSLDTILGIGVKDIMERRLQTILFRKNLARSMNQARQFIVHRHVTVAGKKITSPSYLVKISEEAQISFVDSSALADPNHPERYEEEAAVKKKEKPIEIKKPKKPKMEETEAIAAFEEVHETEEDIVKDIKPKKEIKAEEVEEEKKDEEVKK
ncbi:MAG: 30S ribosomal protein S4 [archaeon]